MQALATHPGARPSKALLAMLTALVAAFLLGGAGGYIARSWSLASATTTTTTAITSTTPSTSTSPAVPAPQRTPQQTILP